MRLDSKKLDSTRLIDPKVQLVTRLELRKRISSFRAAQLQKIRFD
jgi:hypothetical protein